MSLRIRADVVVVTVTLLMGCGPSPEARAFGAADGGAPAGLWPVTGATSLRFEDSGNLFANEPFCVQDGGLTLGASFHLTWPQGSLSYAVCSAGVYREGQRTLSAAELAELDALLHAVTPSTAQLCDTPTHSLEIVTPTAAVCWQDVGCSAMPSGVVGTQGLDVVLDTLKTFAP